MPSLPNCKVCRKQLSLKGPAPFLLPCLHDVCEVCVTSVAGGVISCSPCQRDVNLTETHLQKDVITEKEILHLTVKHHPELVLCTHEDDGNQAVCWCKECEDFFCENCQNLHNSFKGTRKHPVQNIGELEADTLNQDRYCSIHPKFIADTWDTDCCVLTCTTCRRTDHVDHKVVYVDETADSERKEVEWLLKDVISSIDKHEAHLAAVVSDLTTSEQTFNMFPDKITHTFHDLKTLLDQREKEMQIELQQHKEKVLEDLREKWSSSKTSLKRCQTISDYINKILKYSSVHDILELRPKIEEKSQDCRSSAPPEDYKSLRLPVFNTAGLEKIKSTLAQFGTIATEVDQIEVSEDETKRVEDLTQELQRMTEEISQLKLSQEKLIREKENATKSEKEAEKLKQEVQELRSSETKLVKEKGDAERKSEEEVKKLKQEVKELRSSKTKLVKEKRDAERKCMIEKEKLNKIVWISKACRAKIVSQEHDVERLSGLYRLRTKDLDSSFLLLCTNIKFSRTKYNAEKVHINAEGELINKSQIDTPHSNHRLKKYIGTSSTAPLPKCDSPQYFEVKSRMWIDEPLTKRKLLLEIGLVREEEQDQHHCVGGQFHSYSVNVSRCTTHSSICREIRRHNMQITCLPDTLENTPGTLGTLHYGVVYDSARSRIAFLDVMDKRIIGKIDNVDSSVALWPMFGVYYSSKGTIVMSLIVGSDIDMTDNKKALILDCLK